MVQAPSTGDGLRLLCERTVGTLLVHGRRGTPKCEKFVTDEAYCRDLGLMDYKACWDLQQELFDASLPASGRSGTPEAAPYSPPETPQRSTPQRMTIPSARSCSWSTPRSTRSARADMRRTCSSRARCSSGWVPASTHRPRRRHHLPRSGAAGLLSDPRPRAARHRAARLHCRSRRGRHPHRRPPGIEAGRIDAPRASGSARESLPAERGRCGRSAQ
mgnify:CR=1 FL=1